MITEGEKKAEALVLKTGIPCVAVAGIHMWFDPEADRRDALSKRALHPELAEILSAYTDWVSGKPVILVLFDSDGRPGAKREGAQEVRQGRKTMFVSNPDVYLAARTLAQRIYEDRNMSVATSAEWCPEGRNGVRQGLDDWLVAAEADSVRETILSWAEDPGRKILNPSGLPSHIITGNFAEDVDAHQRALVASEDLYVFGTGLAVISPNGGSLVPVAHESTIAYEVSKMLQTCTIDPNAGLKGIPPSPRICTALLHKVWADVPGMRAVDAIARQPVPMLVDKKLVISGEGYDPVTRTYGVFSAAQWAVQSHATAAEYIEACLALGELISEMYLQSPADVAAALAAMLTAVCRPGLPVAPGFIVSAPNPGSGKSYFAQVLSVLAGDDGVRVQPEVLTLKMRGQNAESEFSKMMLGALRSPASTLLFDEIDGPSIDMPSLRKLITSPVFSERRLGTNDVLALPTRKLVIITANNVDPTQDSARRFILIRINPPVDPSKRNQKPTGGALDLVQANREKYVRAAITVVAQSHLLCRGCMPAGMQPLSGFPDWSVLCAASATLAAWMLIAESAEPVNLIDKSELDAIAEMDPLQVSVEALSPMFRQRQVAAADPAKMALRDLLESLHHAQEERMRTLEGADKYMVNGCQTWTASMLVQELRDQRRYADRYHLDVNSKFEPATFAAYAELKASGMRDDQLSNSRSLGQALKRLRDKEVDGYTLTDAGMDRTGTVRWHVKKVTA